jgi:hypothetical protein
MPIPENERVLLDAVAEGTRKGVLGVRDDAKVLCEQDVIPNLDSVVLRGEVAKRLIEEEKEKETEHEEVTREREEELEEETEQEPEGEKVTRTITLRATIPWDKISYVISGVIVPLKEKGHPPKITLEIRADSDEGFDRTTLDTKVRETLQQIGAKIENWTEG